MHKINLLTENVNGNSMKAFTPFPATGTSQINSWKIPNVFHDQFLPFVAYIRDDTPELWQKMHLIPASHCLTIKV